MTTTVSSVRSKLWPVINEALKRGVRHRRDLETVISVELALMGMELSHEARVNVSPSVGGTFVSIELSVKEVARGPAKIYALRGGRALRLCDICAGPGCLWCRGEGWFPVSRAR